MSLINAALFYRQNNISIIATGENKRALQQWKKYQIEIATEIELNEQFLHPKAKGLAVICGAVSGNIEVIDVDLKYDVSGTLWDELQKELGEIFKKLYVVQTKSGGYHLYYKCEVIEGNQKFANRYATTEELKENPHIKSIVLIESRGESGYVIAPPTDGYKRLNETFEIPIISIDEREHILSVCRSFNQVIEEYKDYKNIERNGYATTPWEDYNNRGDVIALLEKYGWKTVDKRGERIMLKRPGNTDAKSSGDYHTGLNLFKVFTTSSNFEPGKGYKPFAVYSFLEHNGDFSKAAKELIKLGYGEEAGHVDRKLSTKVNRSLGAGHSKSRTVEILMSEDGKGKKEAEQIVEDVIAQRGETIQTFWKVEETKTGIKIKIERHKLSQFLYDNGFHLYFYDAKSSIFRMVRQYDGFVNEATTESIKKFVKDYIQNLPAKFDSITPNELLEVVMTGSDSYFGIGFIEFLDRKKIDLLVDNSDSAYFPFTNGIVKVDNKGAKMYSYGEVGKVVWQTQVIDFNIDVDLDFDEDLCEFYTFMKKVCGEDLENIEYLLSLTGYILHQFKDPARPFAVVLAEETEDEKNGGGTGKGIFVKALTHLSNVERIDGKNFKLDKNFAFQRVGLDTKIIAIEDVRKNVDFEGFYSIITEGVTVEKKNKDELFIPYKDSPKILFTTNYTMPSVGNHAKRRQRVFEFASYFNSDFTPEDLFGHKLFDDWDKDEWNRFYNLMFLAVTYYFSFGIKKVEQGLKIKRKHIRLNFTEEFIDWWDLYSEKGSTNFEPFKELYEGFLKQNDFDKKDYSQKRFKRALEESAEKFGFNLESKRDGGSRQLVYKISQIDTIN